ncbi:sigma 54-interacting transcriptional regulator [Sporolituus thermophilus]|uniref:PAS domain S-box-containing protein n=1 Tax=Sporolituus thermophilus DSM 23256 TaxID=1123285 RepID=A0A1G7KHM9_9FIRM|nr:sigma 54-interacting transcriptional regulator [Sporolituus thermophilus]SDF36524.1 PAS domain S-box-containing protein [Sporolituus thermophilus DSM 23256]
MRNIFQKNSALFLNTCKKMYKMFKNNAEVKFQEEIGMTKIAFIAPYPELAILARKVCGEKYSDVAVFYGLLENGLVCAQKALNEGFQVIISRGGTANLIRNHIGIPVVEVRVTGYDILRTFSEFIGTNKTIGVVGYRNVVEGCRSVSQMLGIPLREMLTLNNERPDWEVMRAQLQMQLEKAPVDVVVGDALVVSKLRLEVREVRLIMSGDEAVCEAIEEARRIIKVQDKEKKSAEQLRTILSFIHDGVIAIDNTGKITVINPSAESIFKLKTTQVIGKNIKQVIPNTRMLDVLKHGKAEIEQLQNTPSGMVVTNRVPIEINGEIMGVVATFKEAGRIQQTEQKIRTKLYSQGLYAKYSFENIMAWDPEMLRVIERAKRYARTDGTVLIEAESGCGKELFAQSIHQASSRCRGPFVAINCSALPTQLLESELFGYVEGAFTGARKEGKPGLIELAHGGTLFLDEIGDMELTLQARLLRVLEERQVMRLGADKWLPVDIRIVAATNVPLKQRVLRGQFRMDLFHRLNVLSLSIPPLRLRRKDIIPLAEYFLAEFANKYGQRPIELTAAAKDILLQYSWPGNVRELRNIMERISLVYEEAQDVSAILRDFLDNSDYCNNPGYSAPELAKTGMPAVKPEQFLLPQNIRNMKRQLAVYALATCGGNKSKAAKQLGITRATLDRLLRQQE